MGPVPRALGSLWTRRGPSSLVTQSCRACDGGGGTHRWYELCRTSLRNLAISSQEEKLKPSRGRPAPNNCRSVGRSRYQRKKMDAPPLCSHKEERGRCRRETRGVGSRAARGGSTMDAPRTLIADIQSCPTVSPCNWGNAAVVRSCGPLRPASPVTKRSPRRGLPALNICRSVGGSRSRRANGCLAALFAQRRARAVPSGDARSRRCAMAGRGGRYM